MYKNLEDVINIMSEFEQKELYVMLKQVMYQKFERDSWDKTAQLMRKLMKEKM